MKSSLAFITLWGIVSVILVLWLWKENPYLPPKVVHVYKTNTIYRDTVYITNYVHTLTYTNCENLLEEWKQRIKQ